MDPTSGSSLTQLLEGARDARLGELQIRQRGAQQAENLRAQGRAARGQIGGQIFGGVAQVGSIPTLTEVLEVAKATGTAVASITPVRRSLEEVFVRLVQEDA